MRHNKQDSSIKNNIKSYCIYLFICKHRSFFVAKLND